MYNITIECHFAIALITWELNKYLYV